MIENELKNCVDLYFRLNAENKFVIIDKMCYEIDVKCMYHVKLVAVTENVSDYNTPEYNKELLEWLDIDKEYYDNQDFKDFDDFRRFLNKKRKKSNQITLNNLHKHYGGLVLKGSHHLICFIMLNAERDIYDTVPHESYHIAHRFYFGWENTLMIDVQQYNERIAKMTGWISNGIFEIIEFLTDK